MLYGYDHNSRYGRTIAFESVLPRPFSSSRYTTFLGVDVRVLVSKPPQPHTYTHMCSFYLRKIVVKYGKFSDNLCRLAKTSENYESHIIIDKHECNNKQKDSSFKKVR